MFAFQNFTRLVRYVKKRRRSAFCNNLKKVKDFPAELFVKSMARFVKNKNRRTLYCCTQNKYCPLFAVT